MNWFFLIYAIPLLPIAFGIWFLLWCTRDDKRWMDKMRKDSDLFQDAERPFISKGKN